MPARFEETVGRVWIVVNPLVCTPSLPICGGGWLHSKGLTTIHLTNLIVRILIIQRFFKCFVLNITVIYRMRVYYRITYIAMCYVHTYKQINIIYLLNVYLQNMSYGSFSHMTNMSYGKNSHLTKLSYGKNSPYDKLSYGSFSHMTSMPI